MDTLELLKDLAIIIVVSKAFGLIARRLKAPEVAGEIIAGILIGPSILGLVEKTDVIAAMAEVGVILLMFSAGLGTSLKDLKKSGLKATLVACVGVLVPLVGGTLLFMCFYGFQPFGSEGFMHAVFIGTILTATSVSITVQALKELGKLSTQVGTLIMSAAIIDDVIGILVLTAVISMKDPSNSLGMVALKTLLFFIFAASVGYVVYHLMKVVDKKHPHTRRIPILGLVLAFAFSYIADHYFGVADITGAFVAGIVLSPLKDSEYIERKMDINSYMIFGPIFFSTVGLQTDLKTIDMTMIWFAVAFVLVGLITKIVGCGLVAKCCRYNWSDSLKVGVGMMTRGEVALIVAQRGLSNNLMESKFFTAVILLIVVSSLVTPILLKVIYNHDDKKAVANVKA